MKTTIEIAGLGALLALGGLVADAGVADAGGAWAQCNRNCKPGQTRNTVTGCCEGTPTADPPKVTPPRKTPPRAVEPCPDGQERTGDTRGHCCWPGQAWSSSRDRCIGEPTSCPSGYDAKGDDCEVRRPSAAGIDWVAIPGGSFRMGSTDGEAGEKPVRQVSLRGYSLARTETTVNQYRRCVEAGACTEPVACGWEPEFRTWGGSGKGEHPVNCVDWGQAKSFCAWAGGRLPTEAEWEYGARGAEGRRFPWGNLGPDSMGVAVGNFADASAERLESDLTVIAGYDDGYAGTSPVGTFPAGRSPFGLDDMSGNVWEWVADWHASYDASATDNPTGPYAGSKRVLRGGSFYDGYVSTLRGASRGHGAPSDAVDTVGFRCARSVP